ncbi:MAG: Crp/Fnr family transcriptional regulator [Coriobacteriales bacterium]|jgi:CRP-like cAMP-binding protein
MKDDCIAVLAKSTLFGNIEPENISAMLQCLSARMLKYEKGEFILHAGDKVNSVGIVVDGKVNMFREDYWGNRNIMGFAEKGDLFAEVYACKPETTIAVSVEAEEDTTVIFLNVRKILTTCSSACRFHTQLISNFISVLAQKTLRMNEKLEHMSQRTTRDKLLSYLSSAALRAGSPTFTIPYNRQQLADYLGVDRSAMSNELSKMRKEGIIDFERSTFKLLK